MTKETTPQEFQVNDVVRQVHYHYGTPGKVDYRVVGVEWREAGFFPAGWYYDVVKTTSAARKGNCPKQAYQLVKV